MNFKEYLQFVEAMTLSAEDLDFKVQNDMVICSFEHDGKPYSVKMIKGRDHGIDYVWTIVFSGPMGVGSTKLSGTSSTTVYNKMLSCVRKLFDTQKVNGLNFSPAESGMTIPYGLFYREFLRPNPPKGAGFLMVSQNLYLAKDKVRELDVVGNVLPANRMHLAKIELVKIDKAIKRIYDRIANGRSFVTDSQTLDDLNKKQELMLNKFRKSEKDYADMLAKTRDRREAARIAAERESDRLRQEEEMERQRVRAARIEHIKTFSGLTLIRGESLPPSDKVSNETMAILTTAPWISLNVEDPDWILMTSGRQDTSELLVNRYRVYFDDADYIVANFVRMSAKEKRKLAKNLYSDIVNQPSSRPESPEKEMSYMPEELKAEIAKIGPVARALVHAKKELKDTAQTIAQIPVDAYRYWTGKPDPEEIRDRERQRDRENTL